MYSSELQARTDSQSRPNYGTLERHHCMLVANACMHLPPTYSGVVLMCHN